MNWLEMWKKVRNWMPYQRMFKVYSFRHRAQSPNCDLIFKIVSKQNVKDVLAFRDNVIAQKFERYLGSNQLGVYGYYEGKVVVHGWVIFNHSSTSKRVNNYFLLPPQAAFIHFCSVDPKYRGRKFYQALLVDLYQRLEGYSIYIDTNSWNIAAQKAIEKVGAEAIYILKVLFWRSHLIFSRKYKI